jgi:hypothetical protein
MDVGNERRNLRWAAMEGKRIRRNRTSWHDSFLVFCKGGGFLQGGVSANTYTRIQGHDGMHLLRKTSSKLNRMLQNIEDTGQGKVPSYHEFLRRLQLLNY